MFNESCQNPRQGEYYDYLNQHIGNVQRSYYQFLRPVVSESCPEELEACDISIASHDASKYEDDEFCAYCNYFYPCEGFEKDESAFARVMLIKGRSYTYSYNIEELGEKSALISGFKFKMH